MEGSIKFVEAVRDVGPGPCAGCSNWNRCAASQTACRDYAVWLDPNTGNAIVHEERIPSRLWFLRAEETDDVEGRSEWYWRGLDDWCKHRGTEALQTARQVALLEAPDERARAYYLASHTDGEQHDIRRVYRWKAANPRAGRGYRRPAPVAVAPASMLSRMEAAADACVRQIQKSTCDVAVFYLGANRWELLPAHKRTTQNRITQDLRAFVGVFSPTCPTEWVLESLTDSQRSA